MNKMKCLVMIDGLQEELSNLTRQGTNDPVIHDALNALEVLAIEMGKGKIEKLENLKNANKTFEMIEFHVIAWAEERGILTNSYPLAQFAKFISEAGELADHLADGSEIAKIVDDIGDILVTLILLSALLGVRPVICLETAYNEIAGRKGKMVNGVFVKD